MANAFNLRLVDRNIVNSATVSASSQDAAHPIGNLQKRGKSKLWQSFGVTANVTATWPNDEPVSCVSFPICNFFSTATLRVRLYPTAASNTATLDTGTQLCCSYSPTETAYKAGSPVVFSYGGGTYATLYFAETVCQKVVIDIVDSANLRGRLEAAYLVIGKHWSPQVNAKYGATLDYLDTSKHSRNGAGDLMTDRGFINKQLTFDLDFLDPADRQKVIETGYANGMNPLMHVNLFPSGLDQNATQAYQIYGVNMNNTALTRRFYMTDKVRFKMQEI